MLLAFDIGNTNSKVALFDDMAFVRVWRISSDVNRTADEYSSILLSLFRDLQMDVGVIDAVIVSSVVPPLTATFVMVARDLTGVNPLVLSPDLYARLPVTVPASAVREIGTDLLCDALETWCHFKSSCIVIDFGTALSFTAVFPDGVIAGVAIAPGIGTALRSLFTNTAQLPSVSLVVPESSLGMNTTESIQAGIVLGYKSLVEGLVGRMKQDLSSKCGVHPDDIRVAATGGLVDTFKPVISVFDLFDPQLTLKGLRRAAGFIGL